MTTQPRSPLTMLLSRHTRQSDISWWDRYRRIFDHSRTSTAVPDACNDFQHFEPQSSGPLLSKVTFITALAPARAACNCNCSKASHAKSLQEYAVIGPIERSIFGGA